MPRRNLLNREKLKLISNLENNDLNNFDAQHQFHVSRATIYRCLSSKDDIVYAVENGMGKRARVEKNKHTVHDNLVKDFILECQTKGIGLKASFIKNYARIKAIEIGRHELNCSKGWLDSFRQRTHLKFGKIYGEAKGANMVKVNEWKTEMIPRIIIDWRSEFIYNCDETALFWRQTPVKTYFISKFDHSGDKLFKG
ncbi:tigger transposable element-derived protein 4-like [Tetranychus urticae]|uniref:tigger transposable element-derived protein 4-like n=1 Tax=Tetranychus urticae TaxID=32264 RepID=UPI000D65944B|nr:tigger transposable element-derived protein 4-like [Tetranychus urticae]